MHPWCSCSGLLAADPSVDVTILLLLLVAMLLLMLLPLLLLLFLLLLQSLVSSGCSSPQQLLCGLVAAAPMASVSDFVAIRLAAHSCAKDRCVPHAMRSQVLAELRATPLFQVKAGPWREIIREKGLRRSEG